MPNQSLRMFYKKAKSIFLLLQCGEDLDAQEEIIRCFIRFEHSEFNKIINRLVKMADGQHDFYLQIDRRRGVVKRISIVRPDPADPTVWMRETLLESIHDDCNASEVMAFTSLERRRLNRKGPHHHGDAAERLAMRYLSLLNRNRAWNIKVDRALLDVARSFPELETRKILQTAEQVLQPNLKQNHMSWIRGNHLIKVDFSESNLPEVVMFQCSTYRSGMLGLKDMHQIDLVYCAPEFQYGGTECETEVLLFEVDESCVPSPMELLAGAILQTTGGVSHGR